MKHMNLLREVSIEDKLVELARLAIAAQVFPRTFLAKGSYLCLIELVSEKALLILTARCNRWNAASSRLEMKTCDLTIRFTLSARTPAFCDATLVNVS